MEGAEALPAARKQDRATLHLPEAGLLQNPFRGKVVFLHNRYQALKTETVQAMRRNRARGLAGNALAPTVAPDQETQLSRAVMDQTQVHTADGLAVIHDGPVAAKTFGHGGLLLGDDLIHHREARHGRAAPETHGVRIAQYRE